MKPHILLVPAVFLTYLRVKARQMRSLGIGKPRAGLRSGRNFIWRQIVKQLLPRFTAIGFLLLQSPDGSHCLKFSCQNTHTQICIYESTTSPCPWLIFCTFITELFPKASVNYPFSFPGGCLWTRLTETELVWIEVNLHTGEKSHFTNPCGTTPAETFISVSCLSGERMSDRFWK